MPDLLNLLEHKKNTRILVNGTIYAIGPDCILKDVSEEDAKLLLQNDRVWRKYDPKKAAELRAEMKAAAKGRMQLVGDNGPIPRDDKPGEPMDPNVEVYRRPDPATSKKVPENPPQETLETSEPEPEPEPDGEPPQQADPEPLAEVEAAAGEWPDPDESMDIGYLREMAEAYEVTFNSRTPKKTLVKRISAAMYE